MKPLMPMVVVTCLFALGAACRAQTSPPPDPAPTEPAPSDTSAAALSTSTVVVCRDVQDRAPVEPGDSFSSDVGKLCCFSNVVGATSPVQVYHRWYVGDRMVLEIPISVKAASWRCWSRKTIAPSWTGSCRVDVVTEAGDVIGSAPFTLTGMAAAPQG